MATEGGDSYFADTSRIRRINIDEGGSFESVLATVTAVHERDTDIYVVASQAVRHNKTHRLQRFMKALEDLCEATGGTAELAPEQQLQEAVLAKNLGNVVMLGDPFFWRSKSLVLIEPRAGRQTLLGRFAPLDTFFIMKSNIE